MKKFFLFRLFNHSPKAFAAFIVFIFMYLFFFLKKMDMIAFPYNDMFSTEIQDLKFKKYYVVKLNNDRIEFSHFPYWKKDLLEQAPLKYANYLNNNSQNDVTVFLKSKIHDSSLLFFLEKRMTAYHINSSDWLRWYADYSGNPLNKRDSISLIEYHISFEKDFPTLTDSFIICKTIIK